MRTQVITSGTNEKIKLFKSLLTAKGIKEQKKFILCGEKLIQEFLAQKLTRFKISCFIFNSEEFPYWAQKLDDATSFVVPKDVFKELDVVGTNEPLLVLEYKEFEEKKFDSEPQGLELVTPLGDPRNLGALIRSAVGFGVSEVILTQESAHPYLPQAVKASSGAVLYAHFKKSPLKLNELPVVGENIALDLSGKEISKVEWPKNFRLWIGEEGPGLRLSDSQKKKINYVTIPFQRIESLNAMVSTSIALWEWKKSL